MGPVSERQIVSLNRIRVEEQEFVQLLTKLRSEVHEKMESTQNTEDLHALRGEARALSVVLSLINQSRDASDRLDANRKFARY